MKKEKIAPCVVVSREGMESVAADVVRLKLEHAEKTLRMEGVIARIQKRYQEDLLALARQIESKEAGVHVWCQQNKQEFGDKKSIDTLLAIVGFRTTPHRVEKRNSKDTFGKIALRLRSLVWGEAFVRDPDPELDKDALLAARTKLTPEQLEAAGIKFEQDEHFYIEPKSQLLQPTVKEGK